MVVWKNGKLLKTEKKKKSLGKMVSKDVRMSGMQTGETRWEPGLCLWEANFLLFTFSEEKMERELLDHLLITQ